MEDASPTILGLLGVSVGLGLVTFMVVVATAFVKVSVVLFIVRNALGIQQTPPNLVLYAITLALTLYVSAPLVDAISRELSNVSLSFESTAGWLDAFQAARGPVEDYLTRLTSETDRRFFLRAGAELWPDGQAPEPDPRSLTVLIPSFLVAELTRAFQIGFILYLPFVVIDLIVTTILMAMGMAMVTPNLISTPIKLFLFVAVEGWARLVQGLVLSYA